MKLSKATINDKTYLKIRKSDAKISYFKSQDIDFDINGNYLLVSDTSLALDLLDKEIKTNQAPNISKSFNEISNLLYSKVLKENLSFDTSKELAKDIKELVKACYSKEQFKSLLKESKRSSQNRAGFRASLTTKLKELVNEGTEFKDLDSLSHKVGTDLIKKSELNKKYEKYPDSNDFRELVENNFSELLN